MFFPVFSGARAAAVKGAERGCGFRSKISLAVIVCCLAFAAAGLFVVPSAAPAAAKMTPEQELYYRSVYVLQQQGGPAAEEDVDIPRRIKTSDAAESLLHHPDRIFLLNKLAEDLEGITKSIPKAGLFAAYARLGLGNRQKAVELLSRYVTEAPYQAAPYEVLCRTLHALGEYTSLYLMCREWSERDPVCREDRLRLSWTALFNLGRFADARAQMVREGACMGWRGALYAARASLAMEDAAAAAEFVREAKLRNPAAAERIEVFWQRMKEQAQF